MKLLRPGRRHFKLVQPSAAIFKKSLEKWSFEKREGEAKPTSMWPLFQLVSLWSSMLQIVRPLSDLKRTKNGVAKRWRFVAATSRSSDDISSNWLLQLIPKCTLLYEIVAEYNKLFRYCLIFDWLIWFVALTSSFRHASMWRHFVTATSRSGDVWIYRKRFYYESLRDVIMCKPLNQLIRFFDDGSSQWHFARDQFRLRDISSHWLLLTAVDSMTSSP